ncbi:sensor histidine kinase [Methylocystis echinoides]|uniref:histidine kinase n=1 Tax=Methylocystis echinoides TaxID=29468 RepID=A0A9W6GS56_9HYPH|nr:histidine kinase dimerization/phosphoacceptor domain -containing protein [Methylocystis echinoides]GLI92036.1 histidine kinase [Methylocystis echinoides]
MPWVHKLNEMSVRREGPFPWLVALALFGVGLSTRLLLAPLLEGMKFLTFYPVVAAATLLCGWRQGVLVLALSTLTAWNLFFEPIGSFAIPDRRTGGALIGFVIVGAFNVLIVGALRAAIQRADVAKNAQETLFRELQHRVANNLQLVVALLRNAQRNLRNPVTAAEMLNEAEERIMVMSQLHRRLHDGSAYASGLEPLLQEVLANAFSGLPVVVHVDVEDASELSIDQMTAITLLTNEAALNAAKHVFGKGLGSRFDVSLSRSATGRLHLRIADDGPGMGAEVVDANVKSLGMGIMEAFALQLGGSLEVVRNQGASLSVEFETGRAA